MEPSDAKGDGRTAGVKDGTGRARSAKSGARGRTPAGTPAEGDASGSGGDQLPNGRSPEEPRSDGEPERDEQQVANLSHAELVKRYTALQGQVKMLRQQLDKKEEQRITAIKLLKKAKKRHEEEKSRQEASSGTTVPKERGLSSRALMSLMSPRVDRPESPTLSIGGSSISCSQPSVMYRRGTMNRGSCSSMGLKELIDPDLRLATVLDKLASEQVLSVLESFVDRVHGDPPKSARGYPPHRSLQSFNTRMPKLNLPFGVGMLAAGSAGTQSQPSKPPG